MIALCSVLRPWGVTTSKRYSCFFVPGIESLARYGFGDYLTRGDAPDHDAAKPRLRSCKTDEGRAAKLRCLAPPPILAIEKRQRAGRLRPRCCLGQSDGRCRRIRDRRPMLGKADAQLPRGLANADALSVGGTHDVACFALVAQPNQIIDVV